jgi:hypothetical protein
MLRVSVDHTGEYTLQLPHITTGVGDAGLAAGAELLAFVDAVVLRDHDEYRTARADLERLIGPSATDRAAMVAGNFSMMNRALDAVGAPVGNGFNDLAADLGVTIPEHLLR